MSWIGKFNYQRTQSLIAIETTIGWTRLKSISIPRAEHFSFLVDGKIYVFGGELGVNEKQTVEIFDGENWAIGPEFPFYLNTSCNKIAL